ncbi:TonB-dependent receptor [Thalassotalea psychrophila]|uniref:TonB-dependent receptor n=1 Tax=Thalassotalea psychrophila TaxID=3065647 RepID=A0ABY9TYW6_9GAMM|nr:TonB-dependent receptor [Colwelliaceae bacterium SQ149]
MKKLSFITVSIRTGLVIGMVGSASIYAAQQPLAAIEVTAVKTNTTAQLDNTNQDEADTADEQEIERVEVTGSRIKAVDLEGVSPVVVINAEELAAKGFSTAFDALKDLTQNTGVTQGAESAAMGGFTPNAQTVSLRGLGNNQTLVLVNGRRMADYPSPYNGASNFVNLSGIPMAAIARIEVVTAGASAVYGSDAVAGVMNIITKKDVEDTTLSVKAGTTTEGGGDEARIQLVTGFSGDRFSLTTAIEYQHQQPIYSADRSFMDSVDDGPAGHQYLDRGIVVVDEMVRLGFYQDDEDTEDINEGRTLYRDPGEQNCTNSASGYEYSQRVIDEGTDDEYDYGFYCGVDLSGTRSIRNERDTVSAYVSGIYELTDDTELFADVMYTQQDAFIRSGFHYINSPIIEYRPNGDGNMAALADDDSKYEGAEFYDYHTEQRLFAEHELGFRDSEVEDTSLMMNVGVKGLLFDQYDWDITFSRSENENSQSSSQMKEELVRNLFLGDVGEFWAVDYSDGKGSVGIFDPITANTREQLIGRQLTTADSYSNSVTAVISGEAFELPAGDAYFALVAEWNKQGYDINLDDRMLNDSGMGWWNLTGTEGGGDRSRYAVGVELEAPLMAAMSLKLAGRYDQYDDDTSEVGGRFSPQLGLTYQPLDNVLLRASWSKSFRAPDMHRVFASDGGYYTVAVDLSACEDQYYQAERDENGDFPDDLEAFDPQQARCPTQSVKGNSKGSKTLKEEEGTNYGLGVVWDISDNLNMSFDWYTIELEQVVVGESVSSILQTEYYCKDRSNADPENPDYPFPVTERPDIVPGSAQCIENDAKISRSDSGFAGEQIDAVATSHLNAAKQTTEGVDAKIRYFTSTDFGDWTMQLAWTHTLDTSSQFDQESEEIHSRDLWWNFDARSTMNGHITWMQEELALTLSGRRVGSIPIWNQPEEFSDEDSYHFEQVQRLDPYYTFNFTAAYRVTEGLSMTAQVVNIFNPRPPKDESHTAWPYYNGGIYGGASIGRTVSAEIIYVF